MLQWKRQCSVQERDDRLRNFGPRKGKGMGLCIDGACVQNKDQLLRARSDIMYENSIIYMSIVSCVQMHLNPKSHGESA